MASLTPCVWQLLRGCGIHSSIIKDALKCMDPTNTGSISFTSFSNGLKLVRNPEVIKKAINSKCAMPCHTRTRRCSIDRTHERTNARTHEQISWRSRTLRLSQAN